MDKLISLLSPELQQEILSTGATLPRLMKGTMEESDVFILLTRTTCLGLMGTRTIVVIDHLFWRTNRTLVRVELWAPSCTPGCLWIPQSHRLS